MIEARVFPDRMRLLNHFIDYGPIAVKDSPGGGFVFAGRLSPEKGADVLIEAAGRLPNVNVEVLGDGPARPELERLAARVAPGRVHFRGRVDKASVHAAMRAALAVVVPSRWYENQPITILEAFACGVPVIGTRLGGIPELVKDGVNGYTVAPDDATALAARMQALEDRTAVAVAMGQAARGLVETAFAPALHLKGIADIYSEAGAPAGSLVR
jgi:glycosyltransferase involved in cell wall biosynthesis